MKEIKLTQGQVALVDDEDYEKVNQYNWYAHFDSKMNTYYAAREICKDRTIHLHNFIMNFLNVDHKNHDTLDNQKSNLRKCTISQNLANRKKSAGKTSQYKGLTWYKKYSKWLVRICVNYKKIHLGYFIDEQEAALVYNKAATKYFGEFALLNVLI